MLTTIAAACASTPARIASYATLDLPPDDVSNRLNQRNLQIRLASDDRGRITVVTLVHSSGDLELDAASIRAVRALVVTPQTIDCHPVAGTYDASVTFDIGGGVGNAQLLTGHVHLTGTTCAPDHPVLLTQMAPIAPIQLPHGELPPSADAIVEVTVDAEGQVLSTTISESSGSATLDAVALAAARASHYQAAQIGCISSAGTYLMRVQGERTNP